MTGTSLSSKEEKMVLYAIKGERSDSGGCVRSRGSQVGTKRAVIYRLKPAERLKCWRMEYCLIYIEFDEDGEMI